MPAEIIFRKEGEDTKKIEVRGQNTQISINSYGHLAIREFTGNTQDQLIVFDQATTEQIIHFIFKNRSTLEFKQLLKDLIRIKVKDDELPF
jgi:hypothetical protein